MAYIPTDSNGKPIQVFSPSRFLNYTLDAGNSHSITYTPASGDRSIYIQGTAQINLSMNGDSAIFPIAAGAIVPFGLSGISTLTIGSSVDATVYIGVM